MRLDPRSLGQLSFLFLGVDPGPTVDPRGFSYVLFISGVWDAGSYVQHFFLFPWLNVDPRTQTAYNEEKGKEVMFGAPAMV